MTRQKKVCVGRISYVPPGMVAAALSSLVDLLQRGNEVAVPGELVALVPEAQLEGVEKPAVAERAAKMRGPDTGANVVPMLSGRK
jgi:hypothetical protein